jgi:hypothetical protein
VFFIGRKTRFIPFCFQIRHPTHELKLPEKTHVVFKKEPQITDIKPAHGKTLYADAESKARIFVRIDPAARKNLRMHHSRAKKLDPALILAHAAARASAFKALNIDFAGRFGLREVVRPEARFDILTVKALHQRIQRALKVAHGNAPVHDKTFDLMKHRGMRRVNLVFSVDAAG